MTNNRKVWLFILPSIIGFMIFYFLPFCSSIYYTLVDFKGEFVGLSNFINLINNNVFRLAFINTIKFMILCVPLNIIFSLGLALVLNKFAKKNNILHMLFISPLVIPVASVALYWQLMFNSKGTINYILSMFNLDTINWLNSDKALLVTVIIYLWKNVGYNMVLYLGGVNNIPDTYYEAAEIDGANLFSKFVNITMVHLMPTSFFVFIMCIINSFKTFREIYIIMGEYPPQSVYMIQHYMNNMFNAVNYQNLSTAEYILAIVITLLVILLFKVENRISSDFIM